MEAAIPLVCALTGVLGPRFFFLVDQKGNLPQQLRSDINFLEKELPLIFGTLNDYGIVSKSMTSVVDGEGIGLLMKQFRDSAHSIEDSLDEIIYSATTLKNRSSWIPRVPRSVKIPAHYKKLAKELRELRIWVEEKKKHIERYIVDHSRVPNSLSSTQIDVSASSPPADARLFGIEAPWEELQRQVKQANGNLKVISIVGFSGLGKTALASELYKTYKSDQAMAFHIVKWVCAAHKGGRDLLKDIFHSISSEGTSELTQLRPDNISQLLAKKRYFIVIDDIQRRDQWIDIRSAFPDDEGFSSIVVVTTTIQSVATTCSSGRLGYVHKMNKLDDEPSKQLFSEKACPPRYSNYLGPNSSGILKKCDGHPLSLVTVGEFLKSRGWPAGEDCEHDSKLLYDHLENNTDSILQRMRQVLISNYISLPGHYLRSCLLCFSMFPRGQPVKKKKLLRLWSAEGFLEPLASLTRQDPVLSFKELMNRNIIGSITTCNNENVKTCQTYGVMSEYILQMSTSEFFVNIFSDETFNKEHVRRLCLHYIDGSLENMSLSHAEEERLSRVRSLTIYGKACQVILDITKYKLLRVLDLEKCDGLKDDDLNGIHKLMFLKYLSLGGNIEIIPSDIGKLNYLETLDVRKTQVNVIPEDVFKLPSLIHLLGKFMLPDKVKQKELSKFISRGKSNLQTLAGFTTDGSQRYLEEFMCSMKKLRKVKIWCKSSERSTDWSNLTKGIEQFIPDQCDAQTYGCSLSLDFGELTENILNFLKGRGYLSSLKLYCKLRAWPEPFVISLQGLEELCLSSTKAKLTSSLLEALGNLDYLKYLKLIAEDIEELVIRDKAFCRLVRLCFVLQYPTFPSIEPGALPFLGTLQLLCKDLCGLSGIKIECLKHLREVTLDSGVAQKTRSIWEKAAEGHPNRPRVLLLETKREPSDDSVTSETSATETTESSSSSDIASSTTGSPISGNGV